MRRSPATGRLLGLACVWAALLPVLLPCLLPAQEAERPPGSLIRRQRVEAGGQRPSAITFDARGELAIIMAPFGYLFLRDGSTLAPRFAVGRPGGSKPLSPISLVQAPDGTFYASGYLQHVARSLPGSEGRPGPFDLWLGRPELASVVPLDLALDSAGDLYATDMSDGLLGRQGVVRIDRETGAVEVVVPGGGGGLQSARALAFDARDRLYVADRTASAVLRFDRGSGELDRVVVLPSRAEGSSFVDLEFGPDGMLYVLDSGRQQVLRFDLETPGAPEVLIDLSQETREEAIDMALSPSGEVVVLTGYKELLLYAGGGQVAEAPPAIASTAPAATAPMPAAPGPGPPEPALPPPVTPARPAAATRQRLYLGVEPSAGEGYRGADWGVLLREIYRQGFALAAIDHVGALVRDQGLGEAPPEGALELVASVLVLPGERVRLGLAGAAAPSVPLWSQDLSGGEGERIDYLAAVAEVERLARERWPELLRQLGLERFEGGTEPAGAEPPTPSEELDLISQLGRVRAAHLRQARAAEGALAELALGYANLGFLSELQWSTASESLRARSLLYAERLVAGGPSPRALRVRAYARALAGFHAAALADLEAAGSAPAEAGWPEVIEAYCRSDFQRLAEVARRDEALADLAGRLAFRVIADSGSAVLVRRTAEAVLAGNPWAWEVYAGMGRTRDFSLRGAGSRALELNLAELEERLSATPGLPTFAPPAEEPSGLVGVLDSLKRWWIEVFPEDEVLGPSVAVEMARRLESLGAAAAGDAGQPSWQALAHLLGETLFAQIERQAGFESFVRSVDVDSLLEFYRPLWRDHPLAGLVESYGLDPRRDSELFEELVSGLEIAQPRPELAFLDEQIDLAGDTSFEIELRKELRIRRSALDETADDLRVLLGETPNREVAHRLLTVSPDSPAALAELILEDWRAVEGRFGDARTRLAAHPQITRALAERYRATEQFDEAIAVLEHYVREVPDSWAYNELSSVHYQKGDVEEWRRTQEEFLATTEEGGLARARARERLARHYNLRGEFSKARPHADLAAASWSAWGLKVAAWTHEGLGDWQRAEELRAAVSERYESERFSWYFWCRRTGRGDLAAARRLARSALSDRQAVRGGRRVEAGIFLLLEGEPEAAEREFRAAFEASGNPIAGLHLAFTLIDLDRPGAGEVLAQVSEQGPAFVRERSLLGELLELTAASRRLLDGELTLPAYTMVVDGILASVDGNWRANADYFVGRFLETAEAEAEAGRFFERSAEAYHYGMWNSTLAAVRLRRTG